MKQAVKKAQEGIKQEQAPFGACIVKDGEVVSTCHNTVWKDQDITAHAEINAIRDACKKLRTVDLSGCEIYSTTEPCPMCFTAIHWAGITTINYGTSIQDAKKAGFHELEITNEELKTKGRIPVTINAGLLKNECKKLFEQYKQAGGKTY